MTKQLCRFLIYFAGMLLLALGIALNTLTGLGVSPPVSIACCLSIVTGISLGNTTLLIYCTFVLLQFLLLKKKFPPASLLQIPFSLIFTRLIDLFTLIMPFRFDSFLPNLGLLFFAITFTGVGAAMMVTMRLIPNPGDGIVMVLSDISAKPLGLTKNVFDTANVLIAAILGLLLHAPFCGIGIGTVLAMFGIGRVMAVFNKFFRNRLLSLTEIPSVNP